MLSIEHAKRRGGKAQVFVDRGVLTRVVRRTKRRGCRILTLIVVSSLEEEKKQASVKYKSLMIVSPCKSKKNEEEEMYDLNVDRGVLARLRRRRESSTKL